MNVQRAIISPHTEVYAGPFKSTIGKMSQSGWTFETERDPMNYCTRFMARSFYGVFTTFIDKYEIRATIDFPFIYFSREAVLTAKHLVERIEMPVMDLMPVEVGEAFPAHGGRSEVMMYERKEVEVAQPTKNDIIVTPEDIPGLLQKIQEAQKPRAKELLARQRDRNKLDEYKVQAKILSF